MEFLCKSNAKKLASFAETPPKIMGAAHKNGKKATVNDSFTVVESCMQTGFEHCDGLYSYGIFSQQKPFFGQQKGLKQTTFSG